MKVQLYVMVVKAKELGAAKERLLDSIPELEKRGAYHGRWGAVLFDGQRFHRVSVFNSKGNVVATGYVRQGSRTRMLEPEGALNH